jgi:hypothetical protein
VSGMYVMLYVTIFLFYFRYALIFACIITTKILFSAVEVDIGLSFSLVYFSFSVCQIQERIKPKEVKFKVIVMV